LWKQCFSPPSDWIQFCFQKDFFGEKDTYMKNGENHIFPVGEKLIAP
jgi:hypothetical protein